VRPKATPTQAPDVKLAPTPERAAKGILSWAAWLAVTALLIARIPMNRDRITRRGPIKAMHDAGRTHR